MSFFRPNILSINLRLSSLSGSLPAICSLVLGNFNKYSSGAKTGDIKGSYAFYFPTYESTHSVRKEYLKTESSSAHISDGENHFKDKFIAGYPIRIPSGTLKFSLMHFSVRAAVKFPPAESPTTITFFGDTLKCLGAYVMIQ